jgi:hypothetical protein
MDDATGADIPLPIPAAPLIELVYLVKKHLHAPPRNIHKIIKTAGSEFEVAPIDKAGARAVSKVPRTAVADLIDRIIAAKYRTGESYSAGDLQPQDCQLAAGETMREDAWTACRGHAPD